MKTSGFVQRVTSTLWGLGEYIGRSFFPICALVVIVGSMIWGPWISLGLALSLWLVIDRLEKLA